MGIIKNIGIGAACLVVIFILSMLGNGLSLWNIQFWGVKKENAKREVFEQSQSYVEGKRQEALKCYSEYMKADEEGKQTIKSIVSMSFANFDESKLPDKLRIFVYNCKYDSH